MEPVALTFDRQLLWFTPQGQRALERIRVGIVGNGGTGAPLLQDLVYLGVRNFVLVDDDAADDTSMNRVVTAAAADIGTSKSILGRRLIKSVAPEASVTVITEKVQSLAAIDALKGVDVLFGCVDNDGARLILNEIALAYCIPYFDLAVGIEVENGLVKVAGGRVTAVLPGGPCLHCMKQIDAEEARFFLSDTAEQARQIARGYVRGMDVKAPSVVSLNATIAAVVTNEFAIYVSGLRPVNVHSDIDILGVGRPLKAQWMTPISADIDPACVQCALAGVADSTCIERYSRPST
jgi:molybdopterin/thiamine biosynthesis adenylyltransferase